MKQQRALMFSRWRGVAIAVIASMVAMTLLIYHLGSLIPTLLPGESESIRTSAHIFEMPLQLLHLPLLALLRIASIEPYGHKILATRAPSVILGIIAFLTFAYITRRWYGRRSMVLGCIIFVSSAWFLHVSRFAGIDIEYLAGMLGLLAIHIGISDHDDNPYMIIGWLLVNAILLFIPGFVWFILLSLIWQWRILITAWRKVVQLWLRIIWSVLVVTVIGIIAYMLARTPRLLWQWGGIPRNFYAWQLYLRQIGDVFGAIMYHGPHNPQLWLGTLPLLDAFVTAMFLMGILFYVIHWRAARTHLLGSYILVGGVLAGLHTGVPISILASLVYVIATGGVAYTLFLWLRRFPKNQIARTTGILLILLLVGISCFYNLKQYFIAWPHNPETRSLIAKQ